MVRKSKEEIAQQRKRWRDQHPETVAEHNRQRKIRWHRDKKKPTETVDPLTELINSHLKVKSIETTKFTCDRCHDECLVVLEFVDPKDPLNSWLWCSRCCDAILVEVERIDRNKHFQDRCHICPGPFCGRHQVGGDDFIKVDLDEESKWRSQWCPVCIAHAFRNCWRGVVQVESEYACLSKSKL